MIPTINKPTRVARKTSTIIDHIPVDLFEILILKQLHLKLIF